jgi:hypothetical protein
MTGANVGDKVLMVFGFVLSTGGLVGLDTTHFESTISVANQLQQTASGDLHLNTYLVLTQAQS